MKKLVLLLAVVFSVSMFSCGNAEKAAVVEDSAAVENVDTCKAKCCGDSLCADSLCCIDSIKCAACNDSVKCAKVACKKDSCDKK